MSFEIYSYSKSAAKRGPQIRAILIGIAAVLVLFTCVYALVFYQNYRGINYSDEVHMDLPPTKKVLGQFRKELQIATEDELSLGRNDYFEYQGYFFLRSRIRLAEDRKIQSKEYYRGRVTDTFSKILPGYNALISIRQGKIRVCRFVIIGQEISPEVRKKDAQKFRKKKKRDKG